MYIPKRSITADYRTQWNYMFWLNKVVNLIPQVQQGQCLSVALLLGITTKSNETFRLRYNRPDLPNLLHDLPALGL